jgi:superfamily I DNA/RNA helicase
MPPCDVLACVDGNDARDLVKERERHLLYVGCTRARECLLITYSGQPSGYLALSSRA